MATNDARRTKITARDGIQMRRDLVLTRLMDRGLLVGRLVFVGMATKGSETSLMTRSQAGPGVGIASQRGSDLKVPKSANMMLRQEIPVGGRLIYFIDQWEKITDDQWVLSILKSGYLLEFRKVPKFYGIKETTCSGQDVPIYQNAISNLLEKQVIEPVLIQNKNTGFYSTLFIIPKKNGKLRPVTNLRPLNKYLLKKHFKMDTLQKVINLVKKGDWAISIDLTDAYLHIPVHVSHRKFLRFHIKGQSYQWKAMCVGPTSAPRVYTKIMSVVMAYLHLQNIRIVAYLDDLLILNQSKTDLQKDRKKCINLLLSLGFIINVEKSNLEPSQAIVNLGTSFLLNVGLVKPTEERIQKLQKAVWSILRGQNQATDFLHLLGIIASCIEIIPNARLFMRPIQLHLLAFWKPSSQNLEKKIPITNHLKMHLNWWLNKCNLLKGRSIVQKQAQVTVTTDASKTGYGGHMNSKIVQGEWSEEQKGWHINLLEMEAVYLTVKHFLRSLQGQTVLIRSDNTTVLCTIRKQTGRYQVPSAMLQNVGSVELGNRTQHSVKSGPRSRKGQHTGRQTKSVQNITNRMDVEQSNSSKNFSHLGISPCGPVCIKSKQIDRHLLFMGQRPPSPGHRCTDIVMAKPVCVRIPPPPQYVLYQRFCST